MYACLKLVTEFTCRWLPACCASVGDFLRCSNHQVCHSHLQVVDLRQVLRESKLPVSGNKAELVSRILQQTPDAPAEAAKPELESVTGSSYEVCHRQLQLQPHSHENTFMQHLRCSIQPRAVCLSIECGVQTAATVVGIVGRSVICVCVQAVVESSQIVEQGDSQGGAMADSNSEVSLRFIDLTQVDQEGRVCTHHVELSSVACVESVRSSYSMNPLSYQGH